MSCLRLHRENHLVDRIGWLRAAVLGANDGIVSTASLIVGVAAAAATQSDVLIAGDPVRSDEQSRLSCTSPAVRPRRTAAWLRKGRSSSAPR